MLRFYVPVKQKVKPFIGAGVFYALSSDVQSADYLQASVFARSQPSFFKTVNVTGLMVGAGLSYKRFILEGRINEHFFTTTFIGLSGNMTAFNLQLTYLLRKRD